MRCRAADLHVRPVRFVHPRQRIVALAVTSPHPLVVLTVSHGLLFANPCFATAAEPSSDCTPTKITAVGCATTTASGHRLASPEPNRPRRSFRSNRRHPFRDDRQPSTRSFAAASPAFHHAPTPSLIEIDVRPTDEAFDPEVGEPLTLVDGFRYPPRSRRPPRRAMLGASMSTRKSQLRSIPCLET